MSLLSFCCIMAFTLIDYHFGHSIRYSSINSFSAPSFASVLFFYFLTSLNKPYPVYQSSSASKILMFFWLFSSLMISATLVARFFDNLVTTKRFEAIDTIEDVEQNLDLTVALIKNQCAHKMVSQGSLKLNEKRIKYLNWNDVYPDTSVNKELKNIYTDLLPKGRLVILDEAGYNDYQRLRLITRFERIHVSEEKTCPMRFLLALSKAVNTRKNLTSKINPM